MGLIRRWSSEDKTCVVDLFNNGHSASQIADEYGVSRHAVLSLVHRVRKAGKVKVRGKPKRKKRRALPQHIFRPGTKRKGPIPRSPTEQPVSFLDRARDRCCFPLWDDDAPRDDVATGLVCGAPLSERSSVAPAYCKHHSKIATGQLSDA